VRVDVVEPVLRVVLENDLRARPVTAVRDGVNELASARSLPAIYERGVADFGVVPCVWSFGR
jgi:hypothetical protein